MQEIIALVTAGRLAEATLRLQSLIAAQPDHQDALRLLGKITFQQNRHSAGIALLERAAALPHLPAEGYFELGVMRLAAADLTGAAQAFRQALALDGSHRGALYNLGWSLRRQGLAAEAAEVLARLVALAPDHADAWFNLGNALQDAGRSEDAGDAYLRVLALRPSDAAALTNLSVAMLALDRPDEALAAGLGAVRAQGGAAAETAAGNALVRLRRYDEAAAHFRNALATDPASPTSWVNLGLAERAAGRLTQALAAMEQAVRCGPDAAQAWNGLGVVHLDAYHLTSAEDAFRRAVELAPSAEILNNLGKTQSLLGHSAEGAQAFRAALDLAPDDLEIRSNLLLQMRHLPEATPEALYRESRAYGERLEARIEPLTPKPAPGWPRRLRIGYLSPDFNEHSVTMFFEPALHQHDRSCFEIFLYYTGQRHDRMSHRLRNLADHWRDLGGLNQADAARRIHADGLDVLVDLAGHTARSGLAILAHRPAPVQATWLGYPGTTGLGRVDYRITDSRIDPPGTAQAHHSERLAYLPSGGAFRPPETAPDVAPPPILASGTPCFGYLNRLAKMNDGVVEAFCRILRALPHAKLLLVASDRLGREETIAALTERFVTRGVAATQLDIRTHLPLEAFLALMAEVDIALDPFPYSGGTTSLLTLWMGVPVITMAGQDAHSRTTGALLSGLGFDALVATDADAYVAAACALARDQRRLTDLRTVLRARLIASAIWNEAALARDLEALYRRWTDDDRAAHPR